MLADEDLNVVSVRTLPFLHAQHVVDAAESAAEPDLIWCGKPIASEVSAAERMTEVCSEMDTELLVNHCFRFTDKLKRLRELM